MIEYVSKYHHQKFKKNYSQFKILNLNKIQFQNYAKVIVKIWIINVIINVNLAKLIRRWLFIFYKSLKKYWNLLPAQKSTFQTVYLQLVSYQI
jgi:hypothetical protein